jgi:pyruvate ferredoxin oxidoreductase beta subunit/2-oxoisovalerate ferredoxin oxidoreductase beta subunit
MVIPACCAIVTAGAFPFGAYGVPVVASTFASAAAVATGLAHVARLNGEATRVVCWAGDGGTFDIGMATLSAAAERDEDVLYLCYDNEIYGNTGGQRSGATPRGAVTSTTTGGKDEAKKDIVAILAAHRIPYAATISIAHREDMVAKIRRARRIHGFRFFLLHSPCPTGWKSDPADSVDLVRLAVNSGVFPLYEVFDGRRYRLNAAPDGTDPAQYYSRQGRFARGTVDLDRVRATVKDDWQRLEKLAAVFPADASDPGGSDDGATGPRAGAAQLPAS